MGFNMTHEFDDLSYGSSIYIYGTGDCAGKLYDKILRTRSDIVIKGFIDSYQSSGSIFSIPIINASMLKNIDRCKVIIASMHYLEIGKVLQENGINDFIVYDWTTGSCDFSVASKLSKIYKNLNKARLHILAEPLKEISERTYLVLNTGLGEFGDSVFFDNFDLGSRDRDSYSYTNINDFAYIDALLNYDCSKFDDVYIVDVGEDNHVHGYRVRALHVLELIKFIHCKLDRNVALYKAPTKLRDLSIVEAKKIVAIDICKNGSSTMFTLLSTILSRVKSINDTYAGLRNFSDITNKFFRGYSKVCVVRNPYTRLASAYAHFMLHGSENQVVRMFKEILKDDSFDTFCRFAVNCPDIFADIHIRSQTENLNIPGLAHDELTILRMENYSEDLKSFLNDIGLDYEDIGIPHSNRSRPPKCSYIKDYYTPELIKLVNKRYEKDFINFGYDFL